MAIMDAKLEFSDALTMSTAVGSTYSNVIDLGVASPNIGNGEPIYVVAKVSQAPVATQALTSKLALTLEHSHSTTSASFATLDTLIAASVYGNFTLGTAIGNQSIPGSCRRYLRIKYTTSGTTWSTAPKFDSWLQLHNDNQ